VDSAEIRACLERAIAGYELLEHPFYRRWAEGTVTMEELSSYAAQYRHFEALLPELLEQVAAGAKTEEARALLERNLADERGTNGSPSHLELFDDFLAGLGEEGSKEQTSATSALVGEHRSLASAGTASGLAGLLAYEMQLPAVASTKAEGLRRHYGLSDEAVGFWDTHAHVDEDHTRWGIEVLTELSPGEDEIAASARSAARAWWEFLDERESERQLA